MTSKFTKTWILFTVEQFWLKGTSGNPFTKDFVNQKSVHADLVLNITDIYLNLTFLFPKTEEYFCFTTGSFN